ncbi:MAG: hypothetical protein AUK37_03745 [Rhodobacterales bacterium CG2_30_65_12]|nr:MAG: hypothetical protein AUK37_03745 [Rhodobacterales bacterium CG2_30_65_12]
MLVEGVAVARTEADASADFVAMFTLPPLETDRVMTLEAVLADGTRLASEMNVIVEGVALPEVVAEAETAPEPLPVPVPEPEPGLEPELETVTAPTEPEPEPGLEVRPEPELGPEPGPEIEPVKEPAPAPQPEASTVPDVGAEAPLPSMPEAPATTPGTDANQAPPAPVSPSAPPPPTSAPTTAPATGVAPATPAPAPAPEPEAPRILLAGPDGIRVLQDSSPRPQLSIDAISYDDAGEVALAGRGQGAETLRIYLDNAPVGTAEVGPGGDWRAPLPDVDAGVYTLRVDSLSAEGEVTSRVETPFKREAPAVLAAAGEKAAEAVAGGRMLAAITVQPGHTLWAIAEGRYGEGIAYWTIFGANRDQIRDPDWIYPGQVFTLPDAAQ